MPNRSAKLAAVLFASVLSGTSLTSVAGIAAPAASDNCLTAPKEKTPAGSHWYYRLERGTKRQCWYLRAEDDKSARATPQDSSTEEADAAATEPASPPPRPLVRKSVANAHAELTSAQQRVEPDPTAAPEPRTAGTAPALQNSPAQNTPVATTTTDTTSAPSTVATRWPDASEVAPSGTIRLAAAEPQAASAELNQSAAQPMPAPASLAADSSMTKQSASMQMLLVVMLGALALAGLTASIILRAGGARARARQLEVRRERRAMWDRAQSEQRARSPSMMPDEDAPMWPRDHFHDPRAADDPQRRATEMLARLARSAQN